MQSGGSGLLRRGRQATCWELACGVSDCQRGSPPGVTVAPRTCRRVFLRAVRALHLRRLAEFVRIGANIRAAVRPSAVCVFRERGETFREIVNGRIDEFILCRNQAERTDINHK